MRIRRATAVPIITILTLMLGACDVAPRDRTVVLPRPEPSATATPAPPGKLAFELEKASPLSPGSYDQAGYFGPETQFIYGWLDSDRLAAIGVKPVAGAENTMNPDEKAKIAKDGYSVYIGAKGLVGQILAVNWETGETTELHTVQDEVVTGIGLSHDRTKLWYVTTDDSGVNKLSVSDASLTHDLLEVANFTGATPVWSSRDKYLCYFYTSKSKPYLKVFDGATTAANPFNGPYIGAESPFSVDDDTGELVTLVKNVLFFMPVLPSAGGAAPVEGPFVFRELYLKEKLIPGVASKPTWAGSGLMLCLSDGRDGRSLYVLNIETKDPPDEYKGVVNYALSGDRKYICLVRETTSGDLEDIYVGEWSGGIISNEKLVFKGFTAEGSIYFSPDNTKLYLEGRYGYYGAATTALVLKFK